MSKFNRVTARPAVTSPVRSGPAPTGTTYEGAPGYARDAKGELFLLAVSTMVAEDTFYEAASERDARFRALVGKVATGDIDWLARFLPWLRGEANMRSASIVAACEAVRARLAAGLAGGNRRLVDSVLQRADEPGELLAYWTSRHGRAIPKPVKRGVADAVRRLYTQHALLKYDTGSHGFRFGDVIELTHPAPAGDKPWQGELFAHAIDRRHGRDKPVPASLETLRRHAELMSCPVERRRALMAAPDAAATLRAAGMTWEALAGWLQGPMDAAAWDAVIPSMGIFALVRNLRNFDEAGVSDEVAAAVAARIADPEVIAKSRLFPFRFLAAYRAAPSLRWAWALERALDASLGNVPALRGRTLVLVDRSGSMRVDRVSSRSGLNRADTAAVFGATLALRAERADLVQFGTGHERVRFRRGESVLKVLERFGSLGGTNTAAAVRANYRRHDRVVIVTDEQAWAGRNGADPTDQVPPQVPVYTWNLAGYAYGHGPSGTGDRHTFGGLSDAAFQLIPLLEAGRDADWPF